ncbi:hypothetical protein QC999_gp22 [Microbacterium phage Cressida]|uniref:Uncharacterized protein n=1 Tax=Microbacterium phage Cressida TaxID=2591216 RepID=A0A514DI90_9CAUD|nr:hypothetical protein QC999_gp22 [Microbacterium phage Cressida]QDH93328.1 hypothetical protein PBI_CRESSIDA_86 [Microbacterium phage Cressida]
MAERIREEVLDRALEAYYGKPGRPFTPASRDRMRRALLAARRTPGGRTITIDLDTGAWTTDTTLQPGDGVRVAASVLPGMPEPEIAAAYDDYMRDDAAPEPRRMDPAIAASVGRLRGGIEL